MQQAVRRVTQASVARIRNNAFVTREAKRYFSLPSHKVVPMPSLSPTMEVGSIAKWNLKEGDKFDAGVSICEVETDKATVSFDATEEGYIAKILVGSGEVRVGQPLMVTVDEASDVAAFANFTASAVAAPTPAAPKPVAAAAPVAAPTPVAAAATPVSTPASSGSRVFASPFAKKLARESGVSLSDVTGSGPNGRVVAADVMKAASMPKVVAAAAPTTAAAPRAAPVATGVAGVFADFELSDVSRALAQRQTVAKQTVPHYYLSVDLNLTNLLKLREQFNKQLTATAKKGTEPTTVSVQDILIKCAAMAMKTVPDVNAAWMDTFVRRYHQVDVNLVMGAGSYIATPVIKDAANKGLSAIAGEVAGFEDTLFAEGGSSDESKLAVGTFSIHNLGIYGIKSAAPIVLTPQSCALSLGAISESVIPRALKEGEIGDNWQVASTMTATLSCDHRVVDGAVGAQWLSAFKSYVENPITLLL